MLDRAGICAAVILLAAAAVLAGIFLYFRYRHRRARAQVQCRSDAQKLADINLALAPFGFAYDLEQDLFYARRDAWQKQMGYGTVYDTMAPVMSMVIDALPIYFEYRGRKWMVELWKGQYGITTGAETGVYVERDGETEENPRRVFYRAAFGDEELDIAMALYKKGRRLFMREGRHWWLTGFRLGEFSNPGELQLRVSIRFPDVRMQQAFVDGCIEAGILPEAAEAGTGSVVLAFGGQGWSRRSPAERIVAACVQWNNRRNCRRYLRVTGGFDRTIDRLDYLRMEFPGLFQLIVRGRTRSRITWE